MLNLRKHDRGKRDLQYYRSLPEVPYVEGMKEHVRMYDYKAIGRNPHALDPDSIIVLASEVFTSEAEAEHFAAVFRRHCCAEAYVRRAMTDGEYIVFAEPHVFSVSANFQEKDGYYKFSNWA